MSPCKEIKWDKYLCFSVATHQVGFAPGKIKQNSSKEMERMEELDTPRVSYVIFHLSKESMGKEFMNAGK